MSEIIIARDLKIGSCFKFNGCYVRVYKLKSVGLPFGEGVELEFKHKFGKAYAKVTLCFYIHDNVEEVLTTNA